MLPALERRAPLLLAFTFLAIWELAASQKWISTLFFPAPSLIARTLFDNLRTGEMIEQLAHTLTRMALGFSAGAGIALPLGLILGWSARLRRLVMPFIAVIQPLPKTAVLPLIMVIFGIGEQSRVIVVAMSAFFPVIVSTITGVLGVAPLHIEVAQSYGAARRKIFARVILPGALPVIMSGINLGLNAALTIVIVTEIIYAQRGLGAAVWLAWQTFRTEELYATLVVIAALGLGIHQLLSVVSRRLMPWRTE